MPSIIGGMIAIGLGEWGLSAYWWSFAELLRGLLPLLLIVGGLVACLPAFKCFAKKQEKENKRNSKEFYSEWFKRLNYLSSS